MHDYIETYEGHKFYATDPENSIISILDIAHSLAHLCRFNGHCSRFYSVAEHSYYCSLMVPEEYALAALLHDASEAYICDIPSPFKGLFKEYRDLENNIMKYVAREYGLSEGFHHHPEVKKADVQLLKLEAYHLVKSKGSIYNIENVEYHKFYNPSLIHSSSMGLNEITAKTMFLNRFRELKQS